MASFAKLFEGFNNASKAVSQARDVQRLLLWSPCDLIIATSVLFQLFSGSSSTQFPISQSLNLGLQVFSGQFQHFMLPFCLFQDFQFAFFSLYCQIPARAIMVRMQNKAKRDLWVRVDLYA